MNKDQLLKILLDITGDCESEHINSDKALLEFINDDEITTAFNKRVKWYS